MSMSLVEYYREQMDSCLDKWIDIYLKDPIDWKKLQSLSKQIKQHKQKFLEAGGTFNDPDETKQ